MIACFGVSVVSELTVFTKQETHQQYLAHAGIRLINPWWVENDVFYCCQRATFTAISEQPLFSYSRLLTPAGSAGSRLPSHQV